MSTEPTTTPDELHDRITDQALSELLGEQSPPDLSERILAAVGDAKIESDRPMPVIAEVDKKPSSNWKSYVTAACLLIGLGTVAGMLIPAVQPARESARRADPGEESPVGLIFQNDPSRYDLSDDVESIEESFAAGDQPAQHVHGIREHIDELDGRANEIEIPGPSLETGTTPSDPTSYKVNSGYVVPKETLERTGQRPHVSIDVLVSPSNPPKPTESGITNYRAIGGKKWKGDGSVAKDLVVSNLTLEKGRYANSFGRETLTGDRYGSIVENSFLPVLKSPLSTFSIDVDTASYANVRRYLLQGHSMPPAGAVRIEELVNYFDYDYAPPRGDHPFAAHVEVAGCPWQPDHRLVRVALKGKEIDQQERPESNLVFLLDVSGSMSSDDKLPLLKQGMQMLVRQLGENDRVAIVVYAGSEGLALPSTRGHLQQEILASLEKLNSGGSTNGGAGITLAYKIAQENYIEGGANRVILCTDGDFNVGTTGTEELKTLVAERAKNGVFLSVLGFGRGNLNDEMMETISNRGNGNYSYIDNLTEARKVLVSQMSGTLVTIAKDVKIQIEFNPAQVQSYRLIGYENRMLAAKDFNDDKKDAGEIGAGHTVTALYEIDPVGKAAGKPAKRTTDPLKYQPKKQPKQEKPAGDKAPNNKLSKELLTLKLRYKQPEGRKSQLMEVPVTDSRVPFARSSKDFQFAAAVASFGMLLRGSEHRGSSSYSAVEEIAAASRGKDRHGYRAEFLDIVRRAKSLER